MQDRKKTCYEIAEPMIARATERFAPGFIEDTDRKQMFERYCHAFDQMMDEFDAESFSVEIDDDDMTVALSFESMEFIVSGKQHLFLQFMERSVEFSVYWVDTCTAGVKFTFPSIWRRLT